RLSQLVDGDGQHAERDDDQETDLELLPRDERGSLHRPPRNVRMYSSSLAAISSGVPMNAIRRSCSKATLLPMRKDERISCDTTTLVTPSSRGSFMMSRVIVPVVSGSRPDV